MRFLALPPPHMGASNKLIKMGGKNFQLGKVPVDPYRHPLLTSVKYVVVFYNYNLFMGIDVD